MKLRIKESERLQSIGVCKADADLMAGTIVNAEPVGEGSNFYKTEKGYWVFIPDDAEIIEENINFQLPHPNPEST